ncbi:uncharacterized protein NECHADRAFT_39320 [Fusarium vanettenii 77-13-4]|uniref:DUF3533 domain-containing protein n=1 Tax=Fusarium vanettenii (strain ATCC MYA-4622 / CBS 123669 / FGSC 9596 / NRRL 45880 / 77-13-4) TaxID=660122 RepID=C7Z866_FUSV7|nr:uncharacterized protein NECHADRAFT_39320 [Fusarium vanettenii 77-13-4]EEU39815.1 hypothetical protein NECHADRAFT_39320 [Fusarium vanettenii 77-13-4]
MSLFPPRSSSRKPFRSPYWTQRWPQFIIPVTIVGIILQLLFLANMSYLYGVLFKSGSRAQALKVLAVDYDGVEIGKSLSLAYQALEAKTFPTLEYRSISEYPNPDLLQEAVCKGGYWGAIYTHADASTRLMDAIQGKNTTYYDPRKTVSYIFNGVYYPVITSSIIDPGMRALVSAASRIYCRVANEARLAVNLSDPISSNVFLNPIEASSIDLMPTSQGSRVLFNTVSMVMPILMQFFFSMAMNGIFTETGVFAKLSKRDIYAVRLIISKVYTLMCGICMSGYIWAFREDWGASRGQFFETWMCLWLYMEVNYLIVDSVLDVVVPIKFFAFFFLTWIILNVASTIWPFELSAGFYRWSYALPAHNTWTLLMTIWSGGCRAQNEVALPVLFTWWVVGHVTSAWAVRRRCLMNESIDEAKPLEMERSASVMKDS